MCPQHHPSPPRRGGWLEVGEGYEWTLAPLAGPEAWTTRWFNQDNLRLSVLVCGGT